jgi:hypothetical protein
MEPVVKHVDNGRIFSRTLCPLPRGGFFEKYRELEKLYAEAMGTEDG